MNPLLNFATLPRYSQIRPEHISPAIDLLLEQAQEVVTQLLASQAPPDWDNTVLPLDNATERLNRAWGVVGHLNAVINSAAWREAYNTNLTKVTAFYTDLGQNEALFARYRALAAAPAFADSSPARRKIIDNELRDFRLSGAELPEADKQRFKAIQERKANLSSTFSDHLLDATDAWTDYVPEDSLAGVPEDVVTALREAATAEGQEGCKLSLHMPCYLPLMQYADDRDLRERLYRAYATRASELGPAELDNSALLVELLHCRREAAALLGFDSYAHYSLVTKMADSPDEVVAFLRDLAQRARPYAQQDREELEAFARAELGMEALESWDVAYVSEKLRVARYAFSDQEVKAYFPEPVVLQGLFRVIETLYGLTVRATEADTWHPDARLYSLYRQDGSLLGQFYVDLYARQGKRGGAWMDDAITRRALPDRIQHPVAYLVCNFSGPSGGRPALFTHDEVITLFHEMGHGLHHLLTQVDELQVSGIHGVEWDAVELPSQFMENFCWEYEVLTGMTAHVEHGEPLPRALFDKMMAARNFQSGMQTVRQIEFSLFDLLLHLDPPPASAEAVLDLAQRVREEVAVWIPPPFNRFPHSFSHIFAGGYAAGYYSYKWAEVLSADAYAAFEESGVLNPDTGERFWREILAVGGSRPARESFRAFRGRDATLDALLRHAGMTQEPWVDAG